MKDWWTCSWLIALGALIATGSGAAAETTHRIGVAMPIVIGHRGASGYLPEHTLAAYYVAVRQGADYIEPDLVSTKDGRLVARHENEISGTTDVAEHPGFASRRTTKVIDGVSVTGWFTEDFTLAELRTLRARERIPQLRPANTRFDNQFGIPTLEEVLALVDAVNKERRVPLGVYPEIKHPSYFDSIGLSMEEPLVRTLHRYGYTGRRAPVYIQSFEVANLRALSRMTRLPLMQLIGNADPIKREDLADIARYADGVGLNKDLIIPRNPDGSLGNATTVVDDAHAAGLIVHAWTFRAENDFLPLDYRSGEDPAAPGDLAAEIRRFLETGLDGFFTDQPDVGVTARDAWLHRQRRDSPHEQ